MELKEQRREWSIAKVVQNGGTRAWDKVAKMCWICENRENKARFLIVEKDWERSKKEGNTSLKYLTY